MIADNRLLLETLMHWLQTRFRNNRIPFLAASLFGLLCYGYAFSNKLVNHDEVESLFMKGATVTSGRWGLGFLDVVFPNYSMPWIYGILAIMLMAAAICLIIRLLSIEHPVLQILLSGGIMAFPSLIGTFAYMFTVSSFALSFCMAVLAVYLLRKHKKLHTVAALGCMVFSLSIYQSYISVAAGLLVVCLIRDLLEEQAPSRLLPRGIGYVLFLAASLGIYYGATQVILVLKDVSFNDYASGNMGFSIAGIPAAIAEAYRSFLRFFTEGYRGLVFGTLSQAMHFLCLAGCLVLTLLWCFQKKSLRHIGFMLFLLAVLPLAINCMYLFTAANAVHTLVLFGFICIYCLFSLLVQYFIRLDSNCKGSRLLSRLCTNAVTLALFLILVSNIYLANQTWLNLQLRYENTYAFYTSLMADIRQMPEFGPGSKLALLGTYQDPGYFQEHFIQLDTITGIKGIAPDSYSNRRFLEYYVGISLPFADEQELQALEEDPVVAQMPVYPYHGSIKAIGDIIVIKLSP